MWTSSSRPLGPLRVIAHRDAVTAIEFEGRASRALRPLLVATAPGRWAAGGGPRRRRPPARGGGRQLRAYFAKELKVFDLPVRPQGTPFQLRVWDQLQRSGGAGPRRTARSPRRLGMTGHGRGRSGWPTGATRSRS